MDKLESSLITVVIPYFNQANLIESVLLQHLNQSLPPHEIIVVDDGSSDESVSLIEKFIKNHPTQIFQFHFLSQKQNSKCPYIVFLHI